MKLLFLKKIYLDKTLKIILPALEHECKGFVVFEVFILTLWFVDCFSSVLVLNHHKTKLEGTFYSG